MTWIDDTFSDGGHGLARLRAVLHRPRPWAHPSGAGGGGAEHDGSELVGSSVRLPADLALWRPVDHSHQPYAGEELVVESVEPASASFVVRANDGGTFLRRGPAVVLRRRSQPGHFVLFASDMA